MKPVGEAYPLVGDYTAYIHVKDAMMGKGMVVPAGDGDGELRLLLLELCRRRYSGFLSLEPHLRAAGRFEGFTNPQLFVEASKAIKRLLTEEGMEWN